MSAATIARDADMATATWKVWGTTVRVIVADPAALDHAVDLVHRRISAVDAAASRYRDDSEIVATDAKAGVVQEISPLLADLIAAALDAAVATDGDLDPTIGSALPRVGYDLELAPSPSGPTSIPSFTGDSFGSLPGASTTVITIGRGGPTAPMQARRHQVPTWRQVGLNGTRLCLPAGVQLDLDTTAKAYTVDLCARTVFDQCGTGVLVAIGGDIATAGPGPVGGWQIAVEDEPRSDAATSDAPHAELLRGRSITLPAGAAVATAKAPRTQGVDVMTGLDVDPVWRTVSVAAPTCLQARTWSVAAIARGRIAPLWLAGLGASARLISPTGRLVTIGGWPA